MAQNPSLKDPIFSLPVLSPSPTIGLSPIDPKHFLGYPDKIPDRSMIWAFKEKLTNKGKIHLIWEELQRQLDDQGHSIKRGTIQDASIITSDTAHAPVDKPQGDAAKT